MRTQLQLLACCVLLSACSDDGAARAGGLRLSSRGLYSDIAQRQIVPEAIEYRPDYALWSDGADKRRWLILPRGTRIDTTDMAHWMFPVGAKLFKQFSRRGKLLETRLVERIRDTGFVKNDYFMGTFVWREDQSDAILTPDGVNNVLGTTHDVPRQKDCIVCHMGEPGAILGFSAVQLSASGTLKKIARKHLLTLDPGRVFELPGDDVERAALGSLHANCGHCHAETGQGDFMHLRFLPAEAEAELAVEALEAFKTTVGVELSDEWKERPERFTRRIVPGDPEASAIAYRMGQRGDDVLVPDQMPPLATRAVDEKGLAAVRAWIESLVGDGPGEPVEPDAGEMDGAVADGGEADAEVDAGAADGGMPVGGEPVAPSEGAAGAPGGGGAVGDQGSQPSAAAGAGGAGAGGAAGADGSSGVGGGGGASGGGAGGAGAGGAGAGGAGAGGGGAGGGAGGAGAGGAGGAGAGGSGAGGSGAGGGGAGGAGGASAGGAIGAGAGGASSGSSGMGGGAGAAGTAGRGGGAAGGGDDSDAGVSMPADRNEDVDESADEDRQRDEQVDESVDEDSRHDEQVDESAAREHRGRSVRV